MKRRLISAAILISVMILLLRFDYYLAKPEVWGKAGIILSLLALFLTSLAASEFISLWKANFVEAEKPINGRDVTSPKRNLPATWLVTSCAVAMTLLASLPAFLFRIDGPGTVQGTELTAELVPLSSLAVQYSLWGLVLAMGLTFGYEMWRFDGNDETAGVVTDRLARATLIYVYLTALFGFVIPHRWIEGSNGMGLIAIIGMITTIKLADSFALFSGMMFGTIKLAPRLSPKKTVQGAMGSFLGATLGMAIVFWVVAPAVFGLTVNKPWWWFVLYVFLITTAGILGDLAESLLKRDAKCKDSSSWIPGLGGILDVLDSLVLACPISYALWCLG